MNGLATTQFMEMVTYKKYTTSLPYLIDVR